MYVPSSAVMPSPVFACELSSTGRPWMMNVTVAPPMGLPAVSVTMPLTVPGWKRRQADVLTCQRIAVVDDDPGRAEIVRVASLKRVGTVRAIEAGQWVTVSV